MVTKRQVRYVLRKKPRSLARETPVAGAPREGAVGNSRAIPAGEFKARCLALMDDVQARGGEYVITKRGAPVAKLVPVRVEPRRLLGSMKGTIKILGDIVGPIGEPWEAVAGRLVDDAD